VTFAIKTTARKSHDHSSVARQVELWSPPIQVSEPYSIRHDSSHALGFFDRARHNVGVAAPAVLQILAEWESIDWFVPPQVSGSIAESLLHEHPSVVRCICPSNFPDA
jgi:hypothetical protein